MFDRRRPPFDEKLRPFAKPVCPELSWLTPGTERRTLKTLRFVAIGSSERRFASKRVLTSAVVVLRTDAFSVMLTTSVTVPGFRVTSATASWFTSSVMPDWTYFAKFAASTVI